jgi:hypothetical protein
MAASQASRIGSAVPAAAGPHTVSLPPGGRHSNEAGRSVLMAGRLHAAWGLTARSAPGGANHQDHGYTGMIVFALVSALGLALLSGTARLVVIMIGLDFFIASFAVGVGGTGGRCRARCSPPRSAARPPRSPRRSPGWPTSP